MRKPKLIVYNLRGCGTWVVFKNSREPLALRPSEVVVVSKRTGRVHYEGPGQC